MKGVCCCFLIMKVVSYRTEINHLFLITCHDLVCCSCSCCSNFPSCGFHFIIGMLFKFKEGDCRPTSNRYKQSMHLPDRKDLTSYTVQGSVQHLECSTSSINDAGEGADDTLFNADDVINQKGLQTI